MKVKLPYVLNSAVKFGKEKDDKISMSYYFLQ